jgi:hypothetical protein
LKPLAIFGVVVVVGLIAIEAGLRATDHPASADALPTPLTHRQFVHAGNAVCDRYYRDDPTIFRNPRTVTALTRDMRIAVPFVDREAADLRALVPPASDAAVYRRLLRELGLQNHDAHAMLHSFETGQIAQGLVISRSAARLDLRLNALANELGLNICGLSGRQVAARYRTAGGAAPAAATAGAASAPSVRKAGSAAAPRLDGRYRTVTKVVRVYHNTAVYPGETSRRTWTFIPRCTAGGCATTLLRPSLLPGSRKVYKYELRPIGDNSYRGRRSDPASCHVMKWNGRVSVLRNSFIDYTTLTVRVTRTRDGRVIAYDGTFRFSSVPQAAARRHGCFVTGHQLITFRGVK